MSRHSVHVPEGLHLEVGPFQIPIMVGCIDDVGGVFVDGFAAVDFMKQALVFRS